MDRVTPAYDRATDPVQDALDALGGLSLMELELTRAREAARLRRPVIAPR